MKKATDYEIINAYSQTGSIWKAAELLKMGGQSIHERLVKLGVILKFPRISESDLEIIKEVYLSGIKKGDGKLEKLSGGINRTIQFISRHAGKMGLTTYSRENTQEKNECHSVMMTKWIKENGHPRGFLGEKHSDDSLAKISVSALEQWANMTYDKRASKVLKMINTKIEKGNLMPEGLRKKCSWKCGWREIAGVKYYFRSSWEFVYAEFLQLLKQTHAILDWTFEEDKFIFELEGKVYIPDFKLTMIDSSIQYHEVKGWFDERSKTKLELFNKYYPFLTLIIIDYKWFKKRDKF